MMTKLGTLTILAAAVAGWVTATSAVRAEEKPAWTLEFAESEAVRFERAKWHAKDYGWLLTFDVRTASRNKLRLIPHLRFEGLDDADEVVWEKSQRLRRKDFDGAAGGGYSLFVRSIIKEVPDSVTKIHLRFDNGEESEEGDDLKSAY